MSSPNQTRLQRRLDALNFFLADVRDGLGPYLAVYLLAVQHWDEASIGLVMSIGGVAGILAQTPAGALVDGAKAKRALLVLASVTVTLASVALIWATSFAGVAVLTALAGAAGSIFAPAIAAVTLGIMGPKAFARRIGRNEAFNHAGNAVAAALAAVLAYWYGPVVVFWLMSGLAVASVACTLAIPGDAIDHDAARGLDSKQHHAPSAWKVLLQNRQLLIFAASMTLFHFANAAMLPLAGQKLALANKDAGTSLMAACIVAAQLVMVPVAKFAGDHVDRIGPKPLFMAAFVVLALRGFLYPLSSSMYWIVGVQLLDGVGAGIFGALFPVVVHNLTRGTGHFNVAQGAIATAQGLGAAASTAFAGYIVVSWGYGTAFMALGCAALAGLILYGLGVSNTTAAQPQGAPEPA